MENETQDINPKTTSTTHNTTDNNRNYLAQLGRLMS